jgi:hypothetical protein
MNEPAAGGTGPATSDFDQSLAKFPSPQLSFACGEASPESGSAVGRRLIVVRRDYETAYQVVALDGPPAIFFTSVQPIPCVSVPSLRRLRRG